MKLLNFEIYHFKENLCLNLISSNYSYFYLTNLEYLQYMTFKLMNVTNTCKKKVAKYIFSGFPKHKLLKSITAINFNRSLLLLFAGKRIEWH